MSRSRRAVGRWRAAVAGVVLTVSPLAVAACGDSGDDGVQQVDENEPDEEESGDDSSGDDSSGGDENEPDEDEQDEG